MRSFTNEGFDSSLCHRASSCMFCNGRGLVESLVNVKTDLLPDLPQMDRKKTKEKSDHFISHAKIKLGHTESIPLFSGTYVSLYPCLPVPICSQIHMFPNTYVPNTYVSQYLCFQYPLLDMFPSICSPIPMFLDTGFPVHIFPDTHIPCYFFLYYVP